MNFRRVLIALTALALFASLASAAIPVATTLTCQLSADNPTIRSEGRTEQVGDLKLDCTGGPNPTATGNDIGFVNINVDYGVPVTSKTTASGIEAMLAIDEPTVFSVCTAATNAAAAVPGAAPTASCAIGAVASLAVGVLDATANNVYQGFIPAQKPNQVQFNNIPVQALAANTKHVFRIVNVRVSPNGVSPVAPTVTVTSVGSSLISLATTGSPTVATPAAGLVTSLSAPGISICGGSNLAGTTGSPNMAMLTFKEGFASALKMQAVPNVPAGAAAANTNITGSATVGTATFTKYMSEGGWQGAGPAGTGVADAPTRLQALFTGLDPNAQYYVSINNVDAFNTPSATAKATLLAQTSPGMTTQAAASFAAPPAGNANGAVPVFALTVSSTGTAQAVWEITAIDPTAVETLNFAVYAVYTTTALPTPSASQTIQLGFAPTATATGAASSFVPRFSALPTAVAGAPVLKCQTSLLFPYVTNLAGWETGLAISNTGKDPFNTTGSTGDCTFNFYGTNAPTSTITFGTAMAPGAIAANTASNLGLVNFSGYGVAVCGFQYAHGFAFVNNSTSTMAVGYLADIMEGSNRGISLLGESFGQ